MTFLSGKKVFALLVVLSCLSCKAPQLLTFTSESGGDETGKWICFQGENEDTILSLKVMHDKKSVTRVKKSYSLNTELDTQLLDNAIEMMEKKGLGFIVSKLEHLKKDYFNDSE